MEIQCDSCSTINTVEIVRELKCRNCGNTLNGSRQGKSKGFSAATLIVLAGASALSGYTVAGPSELHRYPILVEHALVETCLSASGTPLRKQVFTRKRDVCACALQATQKRFSDEDRKGKLDRFAREFEKEIEACASTIDFR